MDGREPRFQRYAPAAARSGRREGRPAFGIGPIARVPTLAALGRPGRAVGPGPDQRVGARPAWAQGSPGTSATAPRPGTEMARARAFGLPSLRRNVCPHFFMTGLRGAIPVHAPHLLKGLVRQDATTSRCQLRGGVHLEGGYVNDVCLSPRFNQCVFYEEDLSAS